MSFFNLTCLGYQDPIRERVLAPNKEHTYSLIHSIPQGSHVSFRPATSKLPPIDMSKYNRVVEPAPPSANPHQGSYVKYTTILRKHTRNASAPNSLYRVPLTTTQTVGWWDREDQLTAREPWTHVKRHVHKNSEMTRFVNEMSLTNKEFSLF
ncbi:sperm microtubule inner protein 11-like [Ptychodera flava]|uniref:sperm microtubule inner protein 11-like n=1 Tax=Ptychodera flava TaxID=63121 RepID=UPI003969DD4E